MRAQVDRAVEDRLLPHPDAVLDHGVDRAADRTMAAHGAFDLDLALAAGRAGCRGLGTPHQRQLGRRQAGAHTQARSAQEGAAVHGGHGTAQAARQAGDQRR